MLEIVWNEPIQDVAITESNKSKTIDPAIMIAEGQSLLKDGDLVVRLNMDPVSQFIKNFNRHDQKYSHAGIVSFENGYPYVYHMVNGEEKKDNPMKKDSLRQFCDPRKNIAFGIYRYSMSSPELSKLKKILHDWYLRNIIFDYRYDLKTNNSMYCSEMISKLLQKATSNRIQINSTSLTTIEAAACAAYMNLSFKYLHQIKIIAIDDLYTNQYCQPVREYNYH